MMASSVLRVIIVDSDPEARAAIRQTLSAVPSVTLVGEYGDVTEATLKAPASRPDVMIVEVPVDPAQGECGQKAREQPEQRCGHGEILEVKRCRNRATESRNRGATRPATCGCWRAGIRRGRRRWTVQWPGSFRATTCSSPSRCRGALTRYGSSTGRRAAGAVMSVASAGVLLALLAPRGGRR